MTSFSASPIVIENPVDIEDFKNEKIVFKLESVKENIHKSIGMVITKEDYDKKLSTHRYDPVLFIADLPTRFSYMYDCLNRSWGMSRDEIFIFYWRTIGTNEWNIWCKIYPYIDSIYCDSLELNLGE